MAVNKDTKLMKQVSWELIHEIVREDLPWGMSYPHGVDDDYKKIRELDVKTILEACYLWVTFPERGYRLCRLDCDRVDGECK